MRYLSKEQVEKVLLTAYKTSTRDHLMLLFSFGHALRASEVANLQTTDVQDGQISVARRKGSLFTIQPLLKSQNRLFDEHRSLVAWLQERGTEPGPLFPSRSGGRALWRQNVGGLATRYMLKAGIPRELAHHHMFKHSALSHMIRQPGMRLDLVKQFAGHRAISSTMIYLNTTDNEAMAAFEGAL